MTNEQFDTWLQIFKRDPDTPANIAARRVILDSVSQSEAAVAVGITRGTVSKAVKRLLDADELVRVAYLPSEVAKPQKRSRLPTTARKVKSE